MGTCTISTLNDRVVVVVKPLGPDVIVGRAMRAKVRDFATSGGCKVIESA